MQVIQDIGPVPTVLLVDDESAVRALIKAVLISRGFRVLEACTGEDALSLLDHVGSRFDAIIVDVAMPGISGYQVADAVRESYSGLGVVCISGYRDEMSDRYNHPERGEAFVPKPFSPGVLVEALEAVLRGVQKGVSKRTEEQTHLHTGVEDVGIVSTKIGTDIVP